MNVQLVATTDWAQGGPEALMVYCARVSSPQNQLNSDTGARLLNYCMRMGHWSVFEQADMTVEIETSRAIAAQLLRHRSFTFQEFSQRYADVRGLGFEVYDARRQDVSNRQNSIDDMSKEDKAWFRDRQTTVNQMCASLYTAAINRGVAKECARFLLPQTVTTRLYMKGTVRSWIHYLRARLDPSTQKEHRDIAIEIHKVFHSQFPITTAAMDEYILQAPVP